MRASEGPRLHHRQIGAALKPRPRSCIDVHKPGNALSGSHCQDVAALGIEIATGGRPRKGLTTARDCGGRASTIPPDVVLVQQVTLAVEGLLGRPNP